jgi:NADPH:quinone reductase-like Zn-dependent oxidoreductase
MKAAVYEQYGAPDVVRVAEVPDPRPARNEVLVRVHATTVSSGDWRMRSAEVPRSFRLIAPLVFGKRPKKRILGTELAGVVEAVGSTVTRWKVGDPVFAFPGSAMGAHAEYVCVPEVGRIAKKPDNLSFEEAAALCFGGSTVLSFIEKAGGIRQGERVLVVGASGAVGSAMVQLAKHYGAEVTAVCSGANAELVKQLGADRVADYERVDFTQSGERYDVVMDTTGSAPVARCKQVIAKGGRILIVNGELGDRLRAPFTLGAKVVAGPAREDPAHLPALAELARAGAYKPVIDTVYAFDDIVEAHRRVDSGRKRGSVVLRVRPG